YYLSAKKNGLIKPSETLRQFWLSPDRAKNFSEEIQYDASLGNLLSKKFKTYEQGGQRPTSFPNIVDEQLLQAGRGPTNSKVPSLKLVDFFSKPGSKPVNPMFVANGTIYNNGERLPFMPHILKALKINKSEMAKEPLCENCKRGEYHDGFSMPLKYAVAASSAFPGLIPQVKFKVEDKKFLRVVDGGAVDN